MFIEKILHKRKDLIMNKKLVIIIIIQAFVVTFLLGTLFGMSIQKKRNNKADGNNKQSENTINDEVKCRHRWKR